jgi:acyl carrier protein
MTKKEFLTALAEELEVPGQELTEDSYWDEIEGFSSLSSLMIIAFIDDNFDIRVTDDQFKSMKQVRDLMDLVQLT